jgi:hypothetical protein
MNMTEISDEYMKQMIATTKNYSIIILKAGPNIRGEETGKIVWEHGRRNFQLRAEGLLSIVCPINDGSGICGVGIFGTDAEAVKKIMDEDPGVLAGIFTYEIHPCRSFPGDSLP